jgi:hypothetical protein
MAGVLDIRSMSPGWSGTQSICFCQNEDASTDSHNHHEFETVERGEKTRPLRNDSLNGRQCKQVRLLR